MLKTMEMDKFKTELLAFKDALEKTGLAPGSPMLMTFLLVRLIKHSDQLKWLTIGLLVLTGVLAVLTVCDIRLRLNL